jgi:hypothetical protein
MVKVAEFGTGAEAVGIMARHSLFSDGCRKPCQPFVTEL